MQLRLMELRKAAGYKSRGAIAAELGVPEDTYKTWETGKVNLSLKRACQIADLLDCSLDEMCGREVPDQASFSDPREAELHQCWQSLDEPGRTATLATAHALATSQETADDTHPAATGVRLPA